MSLLNQSIFKFFHFKKRSFCVLALVFLLSCILGILAPFSIGKAIKMSLPKKISAINKNALSTLSIKLIDLKTGLYHSEALFDVEKCMSDGSLLQIQIKEKIQHGPLIFDIENKKIHFKLAKILNEVSFKNSDKLRFDPEHFSISSFLRYNWTQNFEGLIPNLSVYFQNPLAGNTTFQLKLDDIKLRALLGLSGNKFDYDIRVKNLVYSDNNIFRFKVEGLSLNSNLKFNANKNSNTNKNSKNTTDSTEAKFNSSQDALQLSFEALHLNTNRNVFSLLDGSLCSKTEPSTENVGTHSKGTMSDNLYNILAKLNFKNVILFDRLYGPLNLELIFSDMKVNNKPDAIMKKLKAIKSESITSINNIFREDPIKLELKNFSFQIPEGEITAKGRFNIGLLQNKNTGLKYTGSLAFSAPKKGSQDLVAFTVHGSTEIFKTLGKPSTTNSTIQQPDTENPQTNENLSHYQNLYRELFEVFVKEGILIDAGSNYLSHIVYRDNKVYINGSSKTDGVSRNNLTQLKPPYSLEQKLQFALWNEDLEQIKDLLKQGANPNYSLPGIKNPLHTAAHLGNVDIANILLASNVSVNQIDQMGATPLYWATRSGHKDMVQLLLEKGGLPDTKNSEGWTPLQEAAENGYPEIVELLLAKGALINSQDNEGRTALFWAARQGQKEVIRLLLNKGADPELRNIRGLTAAQVAEDSGFPDVAKMLNPS